MTAGGALRSAVLSMTMAGGIVLFNTLSFSAGTYVVGLRSDQKLASEFARKNQLEVITMDTNELSNTNTFVRILEKDVAKLTHATVVLVIPSQLSANDAMEALIKIHTLKSYHAQSIGLLVGDDSNPLRITENSLPIEMESLFAAAGAHKIREGSAWRTLSKRAQSGPLVPMSKVLVTGDNHPELTNGIARSLDLDSVSVTNYEAMSGARVFLVSPSPKPVNKNLLHTLALIQKIKRAGAEVFLITPYLPYSRSDKMDPPGVTVTSRLVADLYEAAGCDSVFFVRAHSAQSAGFFSVSTLNISGRPTLNHYLQTLGVTYIVGPDFGSQKEAKRHADELGGLPVGVFEKRRNPLTQKIELGHLIGPDVEGHVVAIIDDEVDTGDTLRDAATRLRALGPKQILAVVTHLPGSGLAAVNSAAIDHFVTTDTLPFVVPQQVAHKVVVLSVAEEIAHSLKPYTVISNRPPCLEELKL